MADHETTSSSDDESFPLEPHPIDQEIIENGRFSVRLARLKDLNPNLVDADLAVQKLKRALYCRVKDTIAHDEPGRLELVATAQLYKKLNVENHPDLKGLSEKEKTLIRKAVRQYSRFRIVDPNTNCIMGFALQHL